MISRDPKQYRYLFGPVLSRRLGMSLGVDLIPHKTCSLDCVYCECGKTTHLTLTPKVYSPVEDIQEELTQYLASSPALDHITFSGAGEPTLHSGLGDIIQFVKKNHAGYPLALITNSTMFANPEIRHRVRRTDVILASLDAVSEDAFRLINRPHPNLGLQDIIEGLVLLRKEFQGHLWIEIFIVPGINDNSAEIGALRDVLKRVRPDRIQLNTLDRPGVEPWVRPADKKMLGHIQNLLDTSDVLSHAQETTDLGGRCGGSFEYDILEILRRRPCTVGDIARTTGMDASELKVRLDALFNNGNIIKQQMPRGVFYMVRT